MKVNYLCYHLWVYKENESSMRGLQREEIVYTILNPYKFTQDSGILWILIS